MAKREEHIKVGLKIMGKEKEEERNKKGQAVAAVMAAGP